MESIFKEWICIHCGLMFFDIRKPKTARLSKDSHFCQFEEYKGDRLQERKRKISQQQQRTA